jgi:hypothetical protein
MIKPAVSLSETSVQTWQLDGQTLVTIVVPPNTGQLYQYDAQSEIVCVRFGDAMGVRKDHTNGFDLGSGKPDLGGVVNDVRRDLAGQCLRNKTRFAFDCLVRYAKA